MPKIIMFLCLLCLMTPIGSATAQEDTTKEGEPVLYIDKNTESGRGAFEMNNHFHNYCVAKYDDTSQVYRCKNQCIEKGYPVFNETGSAEEAILKSGCYEIKE